VIIWIKQGTSLPGTTEISDKTSILQEVKPTAIWHTKFVWHLPCVGFSAVGYEQSVSCNKKHVCFLLEIRLLQTKGFDETTLCQRHH